MQDSWRGTPKVTVNLGLRYDYLQAYHEAKNRFAFVNPDLVNPVTGKLGVIQFGGYGSGSSSLYTPYVCQCSSPIHPYNKNIEPQIAIAYSPNRTLAIRGNFAVITKHAGGTGGHSNATAGPGNNSEYAYMQVWQGTGSTAPPSFFLNRGITGSPQNSLYSPGTTGGQQDYSSVPPYPAAGNVINPLGTTGNYTIGAGNSQFQCANPDARGTWCNPSTQNFVDLYYGGRGPQFVNYNLGIQQQINKSAVLNVNYKGFSASGVDRGLGTFDQRHNFNATFNYVSPIGKGQRFFANSRIATWTGGGWSLSGIVKIRQGTPLQITTQGACVTSQDAYQGGLYARLRTRIQPHKCSNQRNVRAGTGCERKQYSDDTIPQYSGISVSGVELQQPEARKRRAVGSGWPAWTGLEGS